MKAFRSPGIYIGLMALVAVALLICSVITAPCVELGIFLPACCTAISVSLFAWRTKDHISETEMLSVYCLLASSLMIAVMSLIDFTDLALLGEGSDAGTGLLLGSILSFAAVAFISVRLSSRFPAALSWGVFLSVIAAWSGTRFWSEYAASSDYMFIISMSALPVGCIALFLVRSCWRRLSDNQYIAALCLILMFIAMPVPAAKENATASTLCSLLLLLTGLQFMREHPQASHVSRITCAMVLLFGVSGLSADLLHTVLGINEITAGIPTFLFCFVVIAWLLFRRLLIPRGLCWSSLATFAFYGITSLLPDSITDNLSKSILSAMLLFMTTCLIYAYKENITPHWRDQIKSTTAAIGTASVAVVCAFMVTVTFMMLSCNHGIAGLLPRVSDTLLWPGDKAFIRLVMKENSLWSNDVGDTSPEAFTLKQYMNEIRPLQDRFSKVISTEAHDKHYQGINVDDLGISWMETPGAMTVVKVDRRSPAGDAGLSRGDRVVGIKGMAIDDIKEGAWDNLYKELISGSKIAMTVLDRSGSKKDVAVALGESEQNPPLYRILRGGDGSGVAYLHIEGFNQAQFRKMKTYFREFKKAGVRDMVLDLRYNRGGIIDLASHLTDLIAGSRLDGRLFVRAVHEYRNRDMNSEYLFERLPESLNISRLVVLTTEDTCSASETVINGLRPYMPVYTVGTTTCGKPYAMDSIEFGDRTLLPVTSRLLNSMGEGHYDAGIRPDFPVKDDPDHDLGDPQEGMLKKALEILRTQKTVIGKAL